MDQGAGVGWRSALMAPVCFLIRSSVKKRRVRNGGGGGSDDGPTRKARRTDIQREEIQLVHQRIRIRRMKRRH